MPRCRRRRRRSPSRCSRPRRRPRTGRPCRPPCRGSRGRAPGPAGPSAGTRGRYWRSRQPSPSSCINADHRLAGGKVPSNTGADVPELRVTVRVPAALDGLGVALQAEALLPQQVTHRVRRDLMALPGQLLRQLTGRLRRPPQRRHRITPAARLDQGQQRRPQPRIHLGHPLAAPARSACPAQRLLAGVQLGGALCHRRLTHARSPGHQPNPAMTHRPGLGSHQQTALPLVQVREQHRELRRQRLLKPLRNPHTTTMTPRTRNYGLILCEPLENWVRRRSTAQGLALRARIVLACAQGGGNPGGRGAAGRRPQDGQPVAGAVLAGAAGRADR